MMDSDLARWYPLIEHPVQHALITDPVRFKVVPAGRRSGKTERAKRFVVREAMRVPGPYFVAAPTRDQVKSIYWEDLKRLAFVNSFKLLSRSYKPPSESHLIIWLPNGSTIRLVGLDEPRRIEGVFWMGGIIDEIADVKSGAWELNISPALDTVNPEFPGYRAWAWLIGVPDGLNHYYDLAEYARTANDPDWKLYHWKSSEILPPDVIEAAKRRMSRKQYLQEYEASFETATGKIYSDYGVHNVTQSVIQPHEQLLWMHDFNYSPLSSAIGVRRNKDDIYLLDEIVLESAVARQSAMEFVDRYAKHENKSLVLYGDPAGQAGEKHSQSSNYTEICSILREKGWSVERKIKPAAPAIRDRQNAVRAKILNAAGETSLYVNPSKAEYAHKGLSTVQFKEGSSFLEDDKSKYQHITTAIGYCVEREWPVLPEKAIITNVVPNRQHHYA